MSPTRQPGLPPRRPRAMLRSGNRMLVSIAERATSKEFQMGAAGKRRNCLVSVRLTEADRAIIDRAANLRGWSRTHFVREAAVKAAEEVLMESTLLRMSPGGFEAFMRAVSTPATPVPEIVASLRRKAPWQKDSARI